MSLAFLRFARGQVWGLRHVCEDGEREQGQDSLKGEKGEKGEKGMKSVKGMNGEKGGLVVRAGRAR